MLSRLASADKNTSPSSTSLSPRSVRALRQTEILDLVQYGSSSDLQAVLSSNAFDHTSLLNFDHIRGTPLAAAYAAGKWDAAELLLRHGAAQTIFVRGATPRSLWCTLPQSHQPPSSRFGSDPPPAPLSTTPADILRALDCHFLQYLDSAGAPLSSKPKPSAAAPIAPQKPQIATCGVDQALTFSLDSGFSFSTPSPSETDVHFPNGPVNLFTNVVVGKTASTSARVSFIPQSGNSAWAVGVIPEYQQSDRSVIWSSSIGWNRGGSGTRTASAASEFSGAESQSLVCAVSVDSILCELTLEVNGAVVGKQTLQPSMFPLRLGICGHGSTRVRIVHSGALSSSPASFVTSKVPDPFRIGDFVCVKPEVAPPPITDFKSGALKQMVQETHSRGIIAKFTSSSCGSSAISNLSKVICQSFHFFHKLICWQGPDQYWTSSGGNPRWIRVHLKPGCRIHDLFVIVQKSDASYCPKIVDIR